MRLELNVGDAGVALRTFSFTVSAQAVLAQSRAQVADELGIHAVAFQRLEVGELEQRYAHAAAVHALGREHAAADVFPVQYDQVWYEKELRAKVQSDCVPGRVPCHLHGVYADEIRS
jgi:hypothetical protein